MPAKPPPATPTGVGTWVHPGPGDRRYVNTATGEIISRRQYDEHFGRLKRANIKTNEEQARIRAQQNLPKGPGRPRNPAKRRQRPVQAPPPGAVTKESPKERQARIERERRRRAGLRGVKVTKPSGETEIIWNVKQFENVDEAAFFISGFLKEFFPDQWVYVVAYGGLSGAENGSDYEEPETDEDGTPITHFGWRTVLGITDISSVNASRIRRLMEEATRIFVSIDIVEVRWRKPDTKARARRA